MENPEMSEKHFDDNGDLLSSTIFVQDKADPTKKIYCHTTKLSNAEYFRKDLDSYYKRLEISKHKFERWMYYFCAEYCISLLKFS